MASSAASSKIRPEATTCARVARFGLSGCALNFRPVISGLLSKFVLDQQQVASRARLSPGLGNRLNQSECSLIESSLEFALK